MAKNVLTDFSDMYKEDNYKDYAFFEKKNVKWNSKGDMITKYSKAVEELKNLVNKQREQGGRILRIKTLFEKKKNKQEKNEKNLAELLGFKEYPKDINEQVQFWTRYFFYDSGKKKFTNEEWLMIIFSSKEFAQKMAKHSGGGSSFHRGALIDNSDTGKTKKEKKKEVEEEINKALNNIDEMFEGEFITNKIFNDINAALNAVGIKEKKEELKKDVQEKLKEIKKSRAIKFSDFKEVIKNSVRDIMKQKETVQKINVRRYEGDDSQEKKGSIFLTINISEGKEGALKDENLKDVTKRAEVFYNAAEQVVNAFFDEKNKDCEFSIGGGRTVQLLYKTEEEIKLIFEKDKKEKMSNSFLNNLYNAKDTTVYGFLGEYLRLYGTKHTPNLTGSITDKVEIDGKKKSLGESFSDANYEIVNKSGEKEKIGLNIKHYVSDFDSDSITLYPPEAGINWYDNKMLRYFSEDELKLIRFVDMNYTLLGKGIQQEKIITPIKNLSYNHLDHFVRISSAAIGDFVNYFFVINNMYVPTSYIYQKIIERLEDKDKISIFNIEFNPQKIRDEVSAKKLENLLIKNTHKEDSLSRITFNGLKVDGLKNFFKK